MPRLLMLAGACALAAMACALDDDSPPSAGLFMDIPTPSGFRKARGVEPYEYVGEAVRIGRIEYRGTLPADEVLAFYRETMPALDWELTNAHTEGDQREATFFKQSQECTIRVREAGSLTHLRVDIRGPVD